MLGFFSKKTKRAVGIDIGSSSIKVVELEKTGETARLLTYGLLEIGPYGGKEIGRVVSLTTEKIVEALTDVIRESKVSTKDSGMSIPFRSSFMRLIELPPLTESQLEKSVPIEARKYVPVPINEVALDWSVLPKISPISDGNNGEDFVSVLLVAIHNNALERFKSISSSAGLANSFLEVESYSAIRGIAHDSNETVMICDIGAGGTKTYVVYKGYVVSSHIINFGSQDITLNISKSLNIPIDEAEAKKREIGMSKGEKDDIYTIADLVVSRMIIDLENIKESFESKYKSPVTKVLLIGGGSKLSGLGSVLEKGLKVKTEIGNPWGAVNVPEFMRGTIDNISPDFAVAVGCALRAVSLD